MTQPMDDLMLPTALRLANWLDADACDLQTPREAAAELRRLNMENEDLKESSRIYSEALTVSHDRIAARL